MSIKLEVVIPAVVPAETTDLPVLSKYRIPLPDVAKSWCWKYKPFISRNPFVPLITLPVLVASGIYVNDLSGALLVSPVLSL